MKNFHLLIFRLLILVSCQASPSSTSSLTPKSTIPEGIDTDVERATTLRILNKMILIRGAGEYLYVKTVNLAEDQNSKIDNVYHLIIVPAHYILSVKANFYKKASDISDMADLTKPPFYSSLDQKQLSQRADVAVAYKKGQAVQLDWKLLFKRNLYGVYKRVFPNPENESELLSTEAYEKLLDEHLPKKNEN